MSNPWKPASSQLEAGLQGLTVNDVQAETHAVLGKLVHSSEASQPLVMPIYHSSTYVLPSASSYAATISKGGYVYLRTGNPTCQEAECLLKNLERGAGSLTFSSGMAAITTAISTVVQNGDHVVAQGQIYSGTHSYLENIAPRNGVETTWLEHGAVEEFEKAIRPNTKLLIGESPSNPRMSVLDLEGFGKLGQEKSITTMVDSTFAPPSIQQPIKYGIDIVAHSATKYLGGHSDVLGGVLTARSVDLWTKLNKMRMAVGNTMSPFEAALLTRGIKTLHMRVEKQSKNAQVLAEYLHEHPAIEAVHYPGLPSHPGHEIAKKQMKAFGGMVTFDIKGGMKAAQKLAESVRVLQLAVSLGGVESLIEHPASMTHGDLFMSPEARQKAFVTDGQLRMSVGIENVEDLKNDLQQALERVTL